VADPTDSGIYEIVNLIDGKRYVGSAKNFRTRWRSHRAMLRQDRHHSPHLQRAWRRDGADAFEFRVLRLCPADELIPNEQAAIDDLRPAYNVCPTAGSSLGRRFSDETKAKIAAKAAGRKCPPRTAEHRANIGAGQRGKPKAAEHMAALQAGRRARVVTAEENERRSASLRAAYADGRKSRERPPEYREKIAAGLRGRKATPEHRANQAAAQRGKKRGPYKKRL